MSDLLSILTRPIVFIDIEATGVDPCKDRIVEFAASVLMPDGSRKGFVQRFNPEMPIPPEATAIHHITDADVANEPVFPALAGRLAAALKGKDIGGYNLRRFDLPILDEEFRRCGGKLNIEGVTVIDCFGIFSKKEPRKLEDAVRRYCGKEHDGAHGAWADADATLSVFLGQLQAHEDLRVMPLNDLGAFSRMSEFPEIDIGGKLYRDKDGDACYAFGKYKGAKVKDQPGYAEWMLSKDFPGSTCDALREELAKLDATVAAGQPF